jgi:hypothetical protein
LLSFCLANYFLWHTFELPKRGHQTPPVKFISTVKLKREGAEYKHAFLDHVAKVKADSLELPSHASGTFRT